MQEEELKTFLGKQIKLELQNHFIYSGKICKLTSENVSIIDKFSMHHVISNSQIIKISEVNNRL